jgi:hypothetical protein
MSLMLDDFSRPWCSHVRSTRAISDSPLARLDCSAPRGATGEVCDVDSCNNIVFVDFGAGAIACTVDELEAA